MTKTQHKTLKERIQFDAIRMSATHCGEKVEGEEGFNPGWPYDEWRYTFRSLHFEGSLTVTFRMGIGHGGKKPDAERVLEALLSDASGVADGESYADWCGNYGFDTDSRRAERVYVATLKQTDRLREWLGPRFHAYVWQTEAE